MFNFALSRDGRLQRFDETFASENRVKPMAQRVLCAGLPSTSRLVRKLKTMKSLLAGLGLALVGSQVVACADAQSDEECLPGDIDCAQPE